MKKIGILFLALVIAFDVWVGASMIDIIVDNNKPNPVHSDYNFFVIAIEYFRG